MLVVYHGSIQRISTTKLAKFLRNFASGEGPDFGDYTEGIVGSAHDLEELSAAAANRMANNLERHPEVR